MHTTIRGIEFISHVLLKLSWLGKIHPATGKSTRNVKVADVMRFFIARRNLEKSVDL